MAVTSVLKVGVILQRIHNIALRFGPNCQMPALGSSASIYSPMNNNIEFLTICKKSNKVSNASSDSALQTISIPNAGKPRLAGECRLFSIQNNYANHSEGMAGAQCQGDGMNSHERQQSVWKHQRSMNSLAILNIDIYQDSQWIHHPKPLSFT
jgi:hypothetical protein